MMSDLARMLAIEDIKTLKARYWLGVDTQDSEMLLSVFAEDAAIPVQQGEGPDRTPDTFVKNLLNSFGGAVSVHQGSSPIIKFQSDDRATGTWTLEDWIWAPDRDSKLPFKTLHGWGHYHDVYRLTSDGWKIYSFLLKRIKVDITPT